MLNAAEKMSKMQADKKEITYRTEPPGISITTNQCNIFWKVYRVGSEASVNYPEIVDLDLTLPGPTPEVQILK